jgi:hypothetical protein
VDIEYAKGITTDLLMMVHDSSELRMEISYVFRHHVSV